MKQKESFLKELESRLAVLEEAERQDILAEYAQHIDLRVAGGLTEEEAIRDFGDLEQLTAEILEAYHVDPGFGKTAAKTMPDPRPALRGVGAWFRRQGARIKASFARVGGRFSETIHRWSAWLGGLFRREKPDAETAAAREEERRMEKVERQEVWTERRQQAGASVRRAGGGLRQFCLWLLRLVWNLFLLLCAAPFAVLGLAALVCLGLLVVLLVQGYPLAGAALVCLGALACCVGLLGLGGSFIWRRKPAVKEEASHE